MQRECYNRLLVKLIDLNKCLPCLFMDMWCLMCLWTFGPRGWALQSGCSEGRQVSFMSYCDRFSFLGTCGEDHGQRMSYTLVNRGLVCLDNSTIGIQSLPFPVDDPLYLGISNSCCWPVAFTFLTILAILLLLFYVVKVVILLGVILIFWCGIQPRDSGWGQQICSSCASSRSWNSESWFLCSATNCGFVYSHFYLFHCYESIRSLFLLI